MGVWIEIPSSGLGIVATLVTPCMGVWIEMTNDAPHNFHPNCHSLYGSVD